jgi:hypothetical protein
MDLSEKVHFSYVHNNSEAHVVKMFWIVMFCRAWKRLSEYRARRSSCLHQYLFNVHKQICTLLEYYAALSGTSLPTFRDSLSVPSSRVKNSITWPLKMGPIDCPETSVKKYHSKICNIPQKRKPHQHRGWNLKSGVVHEQNSVEIECHLYIYACT